MALSPLAQSNLDALRALSATITEGAAALSADLSEPGNQTEDSLTGDEILSLLQATMSVCGIWAKLAEKIVIVQPEYLEWAAMQDDFKPGLND